MSKLTIGLCAALLVVAGGGCSGKFANIGGHDAGPDVIASDDCSDCIGDDMDATPPPDANPAGPCPESVPTPGSACSREGLECEYGTSQYPGCDIVVQCSSGAWQNQSFGGNCPSGPNPAGCPASMSDVHPGAVCNPQVGACHYPLGQCYCGQFFGPPVPALDGGVPEQTWTCDDPGPGCPQPRPRLGTPCTAEGQSCMYLTCDFGQQCTGGLWQGQFVGCAAAGSTP
jgi:hypothetical protein